MNKPIFVKSLSKIVKNFDIFIIDQWGVMHDGNRGYDHAIKCINKLFQLNKKLIIISNSSRMTQDTIKNLGKLGFNKKIFFKVITSGQMIWEELKKPTFKWSKKLGNNCYHIGKRSSISFFQGLNKKIVDKISKADFILGTTIEDNLSALDYVPILKEGLEYDLPFICANPDYESVERKDNLKKNICMGTIGELYKNFGGKVHILGKPSKYIYARALSSFKKYDKSKIIAIGDSLPHDVLGANHYGIVSMLITSGIHKDLFSFNNQNRDINFNVNKEFSIKPNFICENFVY